MKSKITIDVDFDKKNSPIIKVVQEQSPDVRDSLVQAFLQSLDHSSRWLRIEYKGNQPVPSEGETSYKHYYSIYPVTVPELEQEIKLMQALLGANKK